MKAADKAPKIPFLYEKLMLLTQGKYKGLQVYTDMYKQYPESFKVSKKHTYSMWLKYCKNEHQLTKK